MYVGKDSNDRVLFPIHPLALHYYESFLSAVHARNAALDGLVTMAVPTSSVRTLLAWPEHAPADALFVKVTMMPSPMFGDRRLYAKKVGFSVGITKLVQESHAILPAALSYLPESVGFVPRKKLDSGVILRSIPREIREGHIVVAPLFSLVGGTGAYKPLFLTIISRSGMLPLQFVEDVLCSKFSILWLRMSMCFGLLPEVHSQNLLLGLSPSLAPIGRFFYRDFDGLLVDWALRRANSLHEPADMPCSSSWYETYGTLFAGSEYCELVWWKMKVSLYAYLHSVLDDLNNYLLEWQTQGLLAGPTIRSGDLTMMFSRHMIKNIEVLFGITGEPAYNIHGSLNKFLIFLMKIRREIIAGKVRCITGT